MDFQEDSGSEPIYVTPSWVLRTKQHYHKLAIASVAAMERYDLSRRDFPTWLAETLYGFDGQILWPDGRAFEVPNVDHTFGYREASEQDDGSSREKEPSQDNDSGCGDFRWVSDFARMAPGGPGQRPQRRILPRLRLIDLALRIERRRREQRGE